MTIYISLPITGYDLTERKELAEKARETLRGKYPNARITTPFDLTEDVEVGNPNPGYADYMKEDLGFIIGKADTVCFLVDPRLTLSKGVRLEWQAAKIYGKRTMRLKTRRGR